MNSDANLNLGGDPIYARVSDKLREEILSGHIATGRRLKMSELTTRYCVSMIPIRQALQQLQGEGLIVLDPNRGACVRQIDTQFIMNVYDIQGAIEGMVMSKITPIVTAEQIRAATAINDEYTAAIRQADWARAIALNKQFHHMFYHIADNPEALIILEPRWRLIECFRRKFGFGVDRGINAARDHNLLLKALAARDGAEAERIARQHSRGAKEDLLAQLRENVQPPNERTVKICSGASN